MAISYNGHQAIADLVTLLKADLVQLQHEVIAEAGNRMRSQEARDGLTAEQLEQVATYISASIVGNAWAVMDEWGTGSEMDTSNPALESYKSSAMWNPARFDHVIRTRPEGDGQIDIFGRSVEGRGKGGFDLEKAGAVEPLIPSHAVREAMKWMNDKRFIDKINETLQHFPFGRYIIVTKS